VQSALEQQAVDGMQVAPHILYPELQVKLQTPLVQVAAVALAGTGHGVHEVPQELTLVSSKQLPLQLWVPGVQLPLHAMLTLMQAPKQSCCPFGQEPPHEVPSQVALPPVGAVQGVQDMLQLLGSVALTQAPPQM
jgi:hypothetical protein